MENEVKFRSYDGLPLAGTLTMPEAEPRAGVILVHGITSSRDGLGLYSGLATYLEQQRIASFRFDYRAHGSSKLALEDMTLTGIVNDIAAAHSSFQSSLERPDLPLVPVGMSFGGGVTAMWAARTEKTVRMVVLLAPVLDYQHDILGQYGSLDDLGIVDSLAEELDANGSVAVDDVPYGRSLINELQFFDVEGAVRSLKCPVTIIHGDMDSIVPYSLSRDFVTRCKNCQLVNVPGTDHGFGVPEDEDLTWPETKQRQQEVYEHIVSGIRALK